MTNSIETTVPEDELKDIREFASVFLSLSKEDKAVLLANANAFRVRSDIEKARVGR